LAAIVSGITSNRAPKRPRAAAGSSITPTDEVKFYACWIINCILSLKDGLFLKLE
jgi:hypothetical protein